MRNDCVGPNLGRNNYVMFYVNVGVKGRRGVVVFVHTSLEKSVSSIDIVSEFEETLWLSLKLKASDCLLFGVIYRSPSSSESNNSALNDNSGHTVYRSHPSILIYVW